MPSPLRKRARGGASATTSSSNRGAANVAVGGGAAAGGAAAATVAPAHRPSATRNGRAAAAAASLAGDDFGSDSSGSGRGSGGSSSSEDEGGSNSDDGDEDDDDVLDVVGRHLGPALQKAWAVEKDCDVMLRLKRHVMALESMREDITRQRLRLVVRVVAEAVVPNNSESALAPSSASPSSSANPSGAAAAEAAAAGAAAAGGTAASGVPAAARRPLPAASSTAADATGSAQSPTYQYDQFVVISAESREPATAFVGQANDKDHAHSGGAAGKGPCGKRRCNDDTDNDAAAYDDDDADDDGDGDDGSDFFAVKAEDDLSVLVQALSVRYQSIRIRVADLVPSSPPSAAIVAEEATAPVAAAAAPPRLPNPPWLATSSPSAKAPLLRPASGSGSAFGGGSLASSPAPSSATADSTQSKAPHDGVAHVEVTVTLNTGGFEYFHASRALSKFMPGLTGVPGDTDPAAKAALVTRAAALEYLWEYIRHHHLHDDYDETLVNCDAALQALLERQSVSLRTLEVELDRHLFPAPQGPLRFKVSLPPLEAAVAEAGKMGAATGGSGGGGGGGGGDGPAAVVPAGLGGVVGHQSVWHVGIDRLVPAAQTRTVRAHLRQLELLDDQHVYAGLVAEYYREQEQQRQSPQGSAGVPPPPTRRRHRRRVEVAQADEGEGDDNGGDSEDEHAVAVQPPPLTARAAARLEAARRRFVAGHRRQQRVAFAAAAINREVRDLAFVRLLLCEQPTHDDSDSDSPHAPGSGSSKRKASSLSSPLQPSSSSARGQGVGDVASGGSARVPRRRHRRRRRHHHAAAGRLLDTMRADLAALRSTVTPTLENAAEFARDWVGPVIDSLTATATKVEQRVHGRTGDGTGGAVPR